MGQDGGEVNVLFGGVVCQDEGGCHPDGVVRKGERSRYGGCWRV